MTTIITLLGLSVIVFIHELGHMLLAKRAGIGVLEFSIGFGPALFSKVRGETTYSFRLLPLGGYVKLAGLDDTENSAIPEEKKFGNAPLLGRIYTIVAGSFMNLLLGFLLFFFIITFVGVQRPQINSVLPDSPALQAGFQHGDIILSVNDKPVDNIMTDLIIPIQKSLGQAIKIEYKRENIIDIKSLIPIRKDNTDKGIIGVVFGSRYERVGVSKIFYYTFKSTKDTIAQVFIGLGLLIKGDVSMKDMAGPLGIIQFASFGLKQNLASFFDIMALISISLGVINLFPFPVLDGGHLFFLLLEGIRRKPLNKKIETVINNLGAVCLITIMIFVIANDIISWSERVKFLQRMLP